LSAARTFGERQAQFDADNLTAALLIVSKPAEFPEGSLAARWAALVLARLRPPRRSAA
jgi:hypothetical protein